MNRRSSHLLILLFVIGFLSRAEAVGLFKIQLNPGSGLAANPEALSAFQRAAAEWEVWISNPITIYLDADLSSRNLNGNLFDPSTIGETSYATYENFADLNLNYDLVRGALSARAVQPGLEILAALPTSSQVSAIVPDGATFDNSGIGILRANQRALGLLDALDVRADATIRFNTAYTFDYNRFDADDVGAGKTDFQTAAAHEIGHALGFLSDVDDFDSAPGLTSDDLTVLDLFRFQASQKPTTLTEFTMFPRVLKPGLESVTSDTQNNYPMSTGSNLGDGQQASHWKDDFSLQNGNITIGPLIGIMDPTLSDGSFEEVGPADLRAIQLIGYDIVPEPGCLVLYCVGLGWLIGTRRLRA